MSQGSVTPDIRRERDEAQEKLRRVLDYCAGMLAALHAEPYAPDLPTLEEALQDIEQRAR